MESQVITGLPQPESTHSDSGLTNGQHLIWTGQRLRSDTPLYNMALAFTIDGPIDLLHFRNAFEALLYRCDALRTIVVESQGTPQQHVVPPFEVDLPLLDFASDSDPIGAAQAWMLARCQQRFDLTHRLFDTALLRLNPERHIWYLNQHHLITDGWSTALVFRYVADYYERSVAGRLDDAPKLPPYRDYVAFENNLRASSTNEKSIAHWAERTSGYHEPISLYGKSAGKRGSRTARLTHDLGIDRSRKLRDIAGEPGIRALTPDLTLFTIFTSLLLAYLYRAGGQRRLRIGAPSHNRSTSAFRETIGLFIETYPLDVELDDGETFVSLLTKVRREAAVFMRHARPGLSTFELNRSIGVLINYINASFGSFSGLPVSSEWIHPGFGDSHHILRLQIHDFDQSGSFCLHFDFDADQFNEAERRAGADHFLRIVDAFLHNRTQPIDEIDVLSEKERTKLLRTFNEHQQEYVAPASVVDLFRAQARRTPDAMSLSIGGRAVSYAELEGRAKQLAEHLHREGLEPGTIVPLYFDRSVEAVVGMLGVWMAGAAFAAIDPRYPSEHIAHVLRETVAALLITTPDLAKQLSPFAGVIICLDDDGDRIVSLPRTSSVSTQQTPAPAQTPAQEQTAAQVQTPAHGLTPAPAQTSAQGQRSPQTVPWAPDRAEIPPEAFDHPLPRAEDLAYVLYTSGSTGRPKGVMVTHAALGHYIAWAREYYLNGARADMPLFTPLSFDLTFTSVFLPLVVGGCVVIYAREEGSTDLAILRVLKAGDLDVIKLTPSHLALLRGSRLPGRRVKKLIVGGEDLRTDLARAALDVFGDGVEIYNEYGPTEATVGCVVHRFDPAVDNAASVPIGRPQASAYIYLLNERRTLVPIGTPGEIYISGPTVARGYLGRPNLTDERFLPDPFRAGYRMYRTGDLGRVQSDGTLHYLGRTDDQLKVRGFRIERAEIESAMLDHPEVRACFVDIARVSSGAARPSTFYCTRCGLPSNYPNSSFDATGVCNICRSFETYREKVSVYFKTMDDLRAIFTSERGAGDYDCMMLLSGGKDSTYALYRLADMDLRILTFTLDNGFLSDEAKANIHRVTEALGVDHLYGSTSAMNAIFVDSLERFSNVCNGCFKTLYTLALKEARERSIPFIVTGLSRGQFFETRLTQELFLNPNLDPDRIDEIVLEARKAYHRADDVVNRLLNSGSIVDEEVFEEIQFIDFYRYCDATLEEMVDYLNRHAPWIRPRDTGRSTNCLINEAGIFVHKKERGYHNYALPYSWDVRLGHKSRDAALQELDDDIDPTSVAHILHRIEFDREIDRPMDESASLIAYFTGGASIDELQNHLSKRLPAYMVPQQFQRLDGLPLTENGKIDRARLPLPSLRPRETRAPFVAPRSSVERRIAAVWSDVMRIQEIGVDDEFMALGGNSLLAIQIISRLNRAFRIELPLQTAFEASTIARLAHLVENTLRAEIDAMSESEVRRRLAEDRGQPRV